MTERVRVELDGSALKHNVAEVRRRAPRSAVVAVVKSNAYGHGAPFAATHLSTLVDAFAVATVDEAVELRRLGAAPPIWVLSGFDPSGDLGTVRDFDLLPVLHAPAQLRAVLESARPPRAVVVKMDSGMGRLGFEPARLGDAVSSLESRGIVITAVMSHLANADDTSDPCTMKQIECFEAASAPLGYPLSLANSAGVMAWPATHYDMVRPGIMLYGVCPVDGRTGPDEGLEPVMTFTARILALREFGVGQPIGYGGTFVCERPTRTAVVACGYGDGYPRHAPGGTPVRFAEGVAPLIGRVSMDSLVVDVTDLPDVDPHQRVVLWGRGLPAETVASHCGTIAYELFCRLSARPVRVEV